MVEKLYRDMDRESLDKGYNARATVPDAGAYLKIYRDKTDQAKEMLKAEIAVPFGVGQDETLDLYSAKNGAPLFVYIHGGYWRALGAEDSGFMAENFVASGISVAVLNYSLAPAVDIDEIVRQIRLALVWLYQNADRLGYDKNKIYVGGSSAGGHLSAMMLGDDWLANFGLQQNPVAGGVFISGIYDIKPLQLCHINDWMDFSEEAVARNSPIHHIPRSCPPVIVTCGGDETSEFKRQMTEYAYALTAAAHDVDCFEVPARNHFDVVLDLCDPNSPFFKKVRQMIIGN